MMKDLDARDDVYDDVAGCGAAAQERTGAAL
jgi:hypothetical protein